MGFGVAQEGRARAGARLRRLRGRQAQPSAAIAGSSAFCLRCCEGERAKITPASPVRALEPAKFITRAGPRYYTGDLVRSAPVCMLGPTYC